MNMNILFIIWYFLPAGIANTAPIFAAHTPYLKTLEFPLDFHKKYNGKRIFGEHKTIRGLIAGIIIGIVIALLQQYLYFNFSFIQSFVPAAFAHLNPFLFGFLSAIGALGGDAVKSFFKRQLAIPSGKSWFPFDQLDYVIGGVIVLFFLYPLSVIQYILLIIIWFLLHPISTTVGYYLKLKKQPL
jgi:CDP-2,3-bis-(O-geranylgeranyl)-sn-glycerol synthase